MKMTKKDRRRLEGILMNLVSGQDYLLSEKIAVMGNYNSHSNDTYVAPDYPPAANERWSKLNKHIGSDLAMLHTGINDLRRLLQESV